MRHHAKFHQNRSNGCDLTIFKMAAVGHFGFVKFEFLTVGAIKGPILQQHNKFCKDLSNRYRNITIFVIFKMAAASLRNQRLDQANAKKKTRPKDQQKNKQMNVQDDNQTSRKSKRTSRKGTVTNFGLATFLKITTTAHPKILGYIYI